jgi:hypothetical protein
MPRRELAALLALWLSASAGLQALTTRVGRRLGLFLSSIALAGEIGPACRT